MKSWYVPITADVFSSERSSVRRFSRLSTTSHCEASISENHVTVPTKLRRSPASVWLR